MKLRTVILLVLWIALVLLAVPLSYETLSVQRNEYLKGIDSKLYTAALLAKNSLPSDYHDSIEDGDSVSLDAYTQIVDRYNHLCSQLGLQYLWSNLFLEQKIVFTSSTSTSKNSENGDHALFYDAHSDPMAFSEVKRTNDITYSDFHNEWGDGRMVLVPFTDSRGRTYVFGASIATNDVDHELAATLQNTVIVLALIFGIGSLAVIFLGRAITSQFNTLVATTRDIAEGKYGEHTEITNGTYEAKTLSKYIDQMSDAIHTRDKNLNDVIARITKEVARNETKLESIIDNTAEAIITVNQGGIIEGFNQAAEYTFGYTVEEIRGQNIKALVPPDIRADHDSYVQKEVKNTGRVVKIPRVVKGVRKNGELFPIDINIGKLDNEGQLLFVCLVRDITERISSQNKLIKAKLEAEKANQAKSSFLSSMSHEVRTPLNSIMGFSQLLQMESHGALSEMQNTFVQHISENGQHLLELIDGILDLSKIESEEFDFEVEQVSVGGVLDECVTLTKNHAAKCNIKIVLENQPKLIAIANKKRLKQIVSNLISNAIKYNQSGGVVRLSSQQQALDTVSISVKDNGIGISEENMPNLFEPFNRLNAQNSEIPGSGIGLTITKKLVEQMNGNILVTSQEGVGSEFVIVLPCSNGFHSAESTSTPESIVPKINVNRGTILYIEDNVQNQRLMESLFQTQPMDLVIRNSAEEGIEAAIVENPLLILMDVNLPGMSGKEAVRALKCREVTKDIPVIAVSAAAMTQDVESGLDSGFCDYITKPFELSKVIASINVHLQKQSVLKE